MHQGLLAPLIDNLTIRKSISFFYFADALS
ncbi:MAG: hypothetical protein ACI9YH_001908 [Colwellia sp.]